jgi:PST family polysaccharide transporter
MNNQKPLIKVKNKLLANFFSLSILQGLNIFLPLLTFPYLISVLKVDNFGLVMFAQSFVYYFAIFIDYGFAYSATREISINRNDKNKVTEIFSVVMQLKFIFVILSFFIMLLIVNFFDKFNSNVELYYFTFIYIIGQAMMPVWYFQGKEDMKYITYVNLIAKGSFTFLIFIFVNNSDDYLYVPILNGLGYIIAGFFSLLLIYKKYNEKFMLYDFKTMWIYLKDSSDYFLSRLSVSMFTSSNVFVLGIFSSNTIVGYFSVAEKLYNGVRSLYGPISATLYPYISNKRNIYLYKKIFYSVICFNILTVILLWWFAPKVIELLSGEYLELSISFFRILITFAIFTVPSSLLGYSFLAALGFKNYANNSVIIASLVHVSGLFLLSLFNQITAYNVIYMIAISEFIVLIIRVYGIIKHKLWITTKII